MASAYGAAKRITSFSRRFSSSSLKSSQERWARRCRLLDVSRGVLGDENGKILSFSKKRPLPTFPLEARHFGGYDKLQSKESLLPNTPKEFHQSLCNMIRNAKKRVRIASLYIGPATSNRNDCEEAQLLEALSELVDRNTDTNIGDEKVSIKIILDENRALRPVPAKTGVDDAPQNKNNTTSSAEAVARAIQRGDAEKKKSSASLHLFRVLPPTTIGGRNWLPNPLDEIAGVFHIKIYIVDDQLLLSGANLSREYFTDRMDRYLHLVDGANGLVEFYAELVEILCRHSNEYESTTIGDANVYGGSDSKMKVRQQEIQRAEFLREITQHFQDPNCKASVLSAEELFSNKSSSRDQTKSENQIVAVGVPTFQAPTRYFRQTARNDRNSSPLTVMGDIVAAFSTFRSLFWINKQPADKVDFVTDVDATLKLLEEAGTSKASHYTAQLSSAYLNPTESLLSVLQNGFQNIELLTAGKISHGFKPKKKEGSHGKDWTIPSVFDKLVDECTSFLRSNNATSTRLFFWERPDWTFHAKGIWLTEEMNLCEDANIVQSGEIENREVAAVVVGSSNFGYRSFYRDMESNLLLVFPPGSPNSPANGDEFSDIAASFGNEWNNLVASSKCEVLEEDPAPSGIEEEVAEKAPPLPWPILKSIPYVKTFF